jgi:filamentous hemagglutinin family protein
MKRQDLPRDGGGHLIRAAVVAAIRAVVSGTSLLAAQVEAGQLPVPCIGSACTANGATNWLGSGSASLTISGSQLKVTQASPSALLNWQSFNISSGATVTFSQPGISSIAINRIFQGNPSQIFGALNANGVVYLLNQNGILFGSGAQVNVGGLVASSLNMSPSALANGITYPVVNGQPAFQPYTDSNGNALPSGPITIQSGATINSPSGQVLMFAPTISNQGIITTPDGQTILGAGQNIFLLDSTDSNLRGLLIEVGGAGSVTNGVSGQQNLGQIIADRGNVTLAGLAVNQDGLVSATTTVQENGSIILQGKSLSQPTLQNPGLLSSEDTNGTVTLGTGSVTEVTLEGSSSDKTVASNVQPQSTVSVSGATIDMLSGARITATAGAVSFNASPGSTASVNPDGTAAIGRIWIAPDAVIDVSGAQATLPVSDNALTVFLTTTELAGFPQQEDSALKDEYITVDLRDYGTRSNGTTWIGTPIADLSSDVAAIAQDVFQRSLNAGSITLNASQSVLVGAGAKLNVAGGQIDWQAGYMKSSELLSTTGQVVSVADANAQQSYVGTIDSISTGDPRWGALVTLAREGQDSQGSYEAGYVQGANAGAVSIIAPVTVLDGSIDGATARGPLQTITAASASPSAPTFNQIPIGAALTLGEPSHIGSTEVNNDPLAVTFAEGTVLDQLAGSNDQAFNPLTDELPADLVTRLRPDLLGAAGVTRLSVEADGSITLPAGTTLAPGAGGAVTLAAGNLEVDGTVDVPSGSISLESGITQSVAPGAASLTVGPDAQLLAMGSWVNELPGVGTSSIPLYLAGGDVTVQSSQASLAMAAGSLIDVTAGAEYTPTGALVTGKAGSINIGSAPSAGDSTSIQPTLRAFALGNGGSVSISAPFICVSSHTCGQSNEVDITPQLLTAEGFAAIALKSDQSGLTVASDIDADLIQQNLVLTSAAATASSGTAMSTISKLSALPAYERSAENLSLSSTSAGSSDPYADLTIAAGARLTLDPGASISLSSDSRIFDNGEIRAPGGTVSLTLTTARDPALDEGIWLGAGAIIDTSGSVTYSPNSMGLTTGTVYGGGSITLDAQQGFLYTSPTSLLNASGYAASLYVPTNSASSAPYEKVDSAGSAGAISLTAAAGLFAGGPLEAFAAPVSGSAGGSLSITLLGQAANADTPSLPQVAPTLEITAGGPLPSTAEGVASSQSLLGQGAVPASTINAGGFDQLKVTVRNLQDNLGYGFQGGGDGVGSLLIDAGVELSPAVSLALDAPTIAVNGSGTVTLDSSYVALGSDDTSSQLVNAPQVAGVSTLDISAQFIDLIGAFAFGGVAAANLTSATDIRAIGISTPNATLPTGSMAIMGNLTLTAQQVYPATLANYAIDVLDTPSQASTLRIVGEAGSPSAVLSAGGALTLQASNIFDSGTLRAPIGSITLDATNVTLSPGSLISVSAAGMTIPFGETEGGLSWAYPFAISGNTIVYGSVAGSVALPQKSVSINAQQLNFARGANIDISGGGDLQAYEFEQGTSNTQDVLSASVSPNTFAILPSLKLGFAGYDPLIDQGLGLTPYKSVYLSGGDGLAAGTYVLLPARYALLPGAYLVTAVSGYSNLAPGQQVTQLDGSLIVSGRYVYSGTSLGSTQTGGFDITKGTYAFEEAPYTVTSANTFFGSTSSTSASFELPEDAGTAAVTAGGELNLAGSVLANPASGGKTGALDLSANNLIVTDGVQSEPAGTVSVDANQLDNLGVASILLGGTRELSSDGVTSIQTAANDVTVSSGVTLSNPEIILVASGSVDVQAGASVQATGTTVSSRTLSLPSGTALLQVSTGTEKLEQAMSNAQTASDTLTLESGSTLSAPGSVVLAADSGVSLNGTLSAAGASIYLGSSAIVLGTPAQSTTGATVLQGSQLGKLSGAALTLYSSQAPIQVDGTVNLDLSSLTLESSGLQSSGGQLNLTAQSVVLQGSSAGTASAVTGSGSLNVNAGSIDLAGGQFGLGVSEAALKASKDISLTGSGTLASAGDLSLSAGVFQSLGAFDYSITSAGQLTTASPSTVSATGVAGGSFSFEANSIDLGGNFVLPAGALSARAPTGFLEVTAGATLNVAGQEKAFAGLQESADGGRINLQADAGSISIDAGATLDVSAGSGDGNGGSVVLVAPTGTVSVSGTIHGAGGAGATGGSLSVEASSLDFTSLVSVANAGGLTGGFSVHDRGPDSLVLTAGQQIQANQISLTADSGSIDIQGELNASNANGGQIMLAAANDVTIDGELLANATANASRGGLIELMSSNGGVYINSDATLNVGGRSAAGSALQSTGEIWITASSNAVSSVLSSTSPQLVIAGNIEGAANVQVEANQTYVQNYPTAGGDVDLNPGNVLTTALANAATFMQNAAAITTALQGSGSLPIELVPGIDIQVTGGDLTVDSAIDLSTYRFTGVPGVLTLQASGNVNVNASMSDGFPTFGSGSNASSYALSAAPGPSWSYRITAGADLASANPLAVEVGSAIPTTGGSVIVAAGSSATVAGGVQSPTVVRTGTGSIQIAAAQDLVLDNQASVIYTAGEAGAGTILTGTGGQGLAGLAYPVNGGSIDVNVGRNVVGATSDELFSDWLWATAASTARGGATTTAWTINFATFEQGIGALGGGDLTITAGGNISDLGALIPSVGAPINGQLVEENPGILRVSAGGDILGGKFMDMAGTATISAGGLIGQGSVQAGYALYPILAMGDSQFSVTARSGLTIEDVLDPLLLPRSTFQASRSGASYSTYDDASSVRLLSAGGNVTLVNEGGGTSGVEGTSTNVFGTGASIVPLQVAPPNVSVVAMGGDADVGGDLFLWPSATGNLNLLADGNINVAGTTGVDIIMSDADASLSLPTVQSPVGNLSVLTDITGTTPGFYAASPLHGGAYSPNGEADDVPARIVALTGNITMPSNGTGALSSFFIPKPIDVYAGGNIVDLSLTVEQYAPSNVSTISAGGNLTYTSARSLNGSLTTNQGGIDINGPGQLVVDVGGGIDLGTSSGITSSGNLYDPALPSTGAGISVTAGVSPTMSYAGFITDYMATSSLYDSALITYVQTLSGQTDLSKSQALTDFEQLDSREQQPLLEAILVAELRAGGRAAAAAGATHDDYTRAFDALQALFPGSDPDLAAGQTNPYSGNIDLYFSRIYTLSGGDIGLFAPGGAIDVGLNSSLTSFGLTKQASELGVVAQGTGNVSGVAYGDIDVNLSRIFAADGGSILLWSTEGDIDAGRGAKSAISAPAPTISINSSGIATEVFPPALTGSGIEALATSTGVSPGDVDLFAPHGVVNADEAGIVAGNLTIAATAVLGTNNIQVSGTSVGVPVTVTGIGIGAAAAASSSSATANSALGGVTSNNAAAEANAPLADTALGWLEVFVIGLGEEQCPPDDLGCLKRQH